MNIKEQLLEVIRANPGLTGDELRRELARRSWAVLQLGKWVMFGPTYGSIYVALAELAREGLVNMKRGEVTSEGLIRQRRPLRFYPLPPPAVQSSTDP
jgi:DNA-binding PadR family transcriptional regulator